VNIAKIVVAAAVYAIDKPYDYLIPEPLTPQCVPGVRVVVPFGQGNRRTEGFVLETIQGIGEKLKPIESVLDPEPVLSETMIRLAAFLRERYFCTFFDGIRAMLPAGLWFHAKDNVVLTALGKETDFEKRFSKYPEAVQVGMLLKSLGGQAPEEKLKKFLSSDVLETGLKRLTSSKMVISEGSLIRNVSDKTEKIAALAVPNEEAIEYAATRKRAPLQKAVLELLVVVGSCSVKELSYFTGATSSTVKALEKAGYLELSHREVFRRPNYDPAQPAEPIVLREEQQRVYEQLKAHLEPKNRQVSLLYGVTGSGKTMVYLKLISDVLSMGQTALVLVPEIALTPQLMGTFMAHFGDQVAVLHSALQVGQRYDEWKRIRMGKASVVVGTRSAVFAPLQNLGLIVIDEEHETTYKSEMNPRYHAREVAIWRGAREGAAVVLGSATPSISTMFLAKSGIYDLAELRQRYNGSGLPQVTLVDMKEELKNGNATSISSVLREEIQKNMDLGQQTILYLNRRGSSRTVLCPSCGYVPGCKRCSVSLTYHSANGRLMCHYCGYSEPAEGICPVCGTSLRAVGTGTQRIQDELKELWPWVETIRMDADTVSASNPHEKLLNRFQQEQIPILIGTQMVTKGLNFPNVTLVGVLDGDASLYVDDYRAAETTFSKITQVVGRAGRGQTQGRAVIQTMTPENQVLLQAAQQDYDAFYETELPLRQLRNCPPYQDVLRVNFFSPFEREVTAGALRFREALGQVLRERETIHASVMGPSPAKVVRVMNRYHYQLTILAKNSKELRNILSTLLKWFKKDRANKNITVSADVGPLD
jgi:primosomal protein N' (replication factor Y)